MSTGFHVTELRRGHQNQRDLLADLTDLLGPALNHLLELALVLESLELQPSAPQSVRGIDEQLVFVNRLGEVRVGPELESLYRGAAVTLGRGHDHRSIRASCLQLLQQLQSRDAGHVQIRDDQVVVVAEEKLQSVLTAMGGVAYVPLGLEPAAQKPRCLDFVVDDEYLGG